MGVPKIKRDKFSVFSFLGLPPDATEEAERERRRKEEEEKRAEEIKAAEARRPKKGLLCVFSWGGLRFY